MYIYQIFLISVIMTVICFSKGQQTTNKHEPKFSRIYPNISRECLKTHRVTPERLVATYSLNTNDRDAKCYVACMLDRFNVTDGRGNYNEKVLEKLMTKSKTREVSSNTHTVIEKCKKEDDKDICEKAMKFTRCIYTHRNEIGVAENNDKSSSYRRRPTIPFGPGRRPWQKM